MKRVLLIAAAIIALVAAPASAQTDDYDGTSASATVSGDVIIVTGEGFEPGATVDYSVELDGDVVETGSTTANADGEVLFEVQNRGAGTYTISMTDGTNSAVTTITIDSSGTGTSTAAAPGSGSLPTTGSDSSIPIAQIGVVLVVLGAVAIYFARRRRANAFS